MPDAMLGVFPPARLLLIAVLVCATVLHTLSPDLHARARCLSDRYCRWTAANMPKHFLY